METPPDPLETGKQIKRNTPRLVELGMKVLAAHQQDPDKNENTCRRSSHRCYESDSPSPRDISRKAWEWPVFDDEDKKTHRRVDVRFERDSEQRTEGLREDDSLILTLIDEARHMCEIVMQKQTSQPASAFRMTGVSVRTQEAIEKFDFKGDVLKDSEIVAEIESVALKIIEILERHVIGPERREQIRKPLRRLLGFEE